MSRTIVCPSGLSGEVRKLKVKEANILADMAGVRKGTTFDDILKSVWLGTNDMGPYKPGKDGALDWSGVLVADRFYALMQARVATYGPDYDFDLQCSNPGCREKIQWSIDLDKLPFRKLPKASIETFTRDNRFAAVIPSTGRQCFFRLVTGEIEATAAQRARGRRTEVMTLALTARITEVVGVDPNDKLRFLDNLDLDDAAALIASMDEVDGGLDTDIEVECTACGSQQEVAVPFGRGFWLPSKRRKATTESTNEPSTGSSPSSTPTTSNPASGG